jgi:hypothetical protein
MEHSPALGLYSRGWYALAAMPCVGLGGGAGGMVGIPASSSSIRITSTWSAPSMSSALMRGGVNRVTTSAATSSISMLPNDAAELMLVMLVSRLCPFPPRFFFFVSRRCAFFAACNGVNVQSRQHAMDTTKTAPSTHTNRQVVPSASSVPLWTRRFGSLWLTTARAPSWVLWSMHRSVPRCRRILP